MSDDHSPLWSPSRAQAWYDERPWPVGANFLPSTASNQLEMWQAATFDEATIDRELGYAAGLGMNVMRVYLHDLLFHEDRAGLFGRMDRFLALADGHGIAVLFVLLDDCWSDAAALGDQPEPIPGVHNSTWLRCPADRGVERAYDDPVYRQTVRDYVAGTVERFRDDPRVFGWDLYNEPGNPGRRTHRRVDGTVDRWDPRPQGERAVLAMVRWVFEWAREVGPAQPLTVGAWQGDWAEDPVPRASLVLSDLVTFHAYGKPANVRHAIDSVRGLTGGRPAVCTEWLARGQGNTVFDVLPIFHEAGVGAIQWGLVAGRSNTIYPWHTWDTPAEPPEPEVWHHDLLRPDGSAFDDREAALFRELTRRV
ncbi:MAG: 1,4-beta-xylanase [Planctomycetota bacterium]